MGRRGPEPRDAWQHRSPPSQGGEVWCHKMCGSSGALTIRKAGSEAVGRVAASEPSLSGRRGLKP
jgi:hypothetical protein